MKCTKCNKEYKITTQFNPWAVRGNDGKLTICLGNVCYKCNGLSKEEVIKHREFIHLSRLLTLFSSSNKVYMARRKKNYYKIFLVNKEKDIEEIDFSIAVLLNFKFAEPFGLKTELEPNEIIGQLSRYTNRILHLRKVY